MSKQEMPKLYSTLEVIRMLKIGMHRLFYAESLGRIPEARRIGKGRVYTEDDVEMLRQYFAEADIKKASKAKKGRE